VRPVHVTESETIKTKKETLRWQTVYSSQHPSWVIEVLVARLDCHYNQLFPGCGGQNLFFPMVWSSASHSTVQAVICISVVKSRPIIGLDSLFGCIIYTVSQKATLLWLAITLICINRFG